MLAVKMHETRRRIGEAESATPRAFTRASRPNSNAIVEDADCQFVSDTTRRYLHVSSSRARTDAVANCVFDERLEDQAWHECATHPILDVAVDRQAILEAHPLNRDIAVEQPELALERNFLLARRRQNESQKVAELGNHSLGSHRIRRDERDSAVQGVEQEMRVELQLEGVELGLHESRYNTLTFCRFLARLAHEMLHPLSGVSGHDSKDTEQDEFGYFIERCNPRALHSRDRIDGQRNAIRAPQP